MTTPTTMTVLATGLILLGFAGAAFAECNRVLQPVPDKTAQEPILIPPKSVGS